VSRETAWRRRAFRIVCAGWLVGWYYKGFFLGPYLLHTSFAFPVEVRGFSALFSGPGISAVLWLAPVLSLICLALPSNRAMRATALLYTACAFGLAIHLNTFNDATFVTSFWVGLWMVWFTFRREDRLPDTLLHARTLAQCVVGFLFLGGFTGKLTEAYWTGEALYNLYCLQKANFPWSWLRHGLSPEALRAFATWFSRATVFMEGVFVLSPLLPYRALATVGALVMGAMVVFSTLNLLSVFACLLGLVLALAGDPPGAEDQPSRSTVS
jgi:hypothetical protein